MKLKLIAISILIAILLPTVSCTKKKTEIDWVLTFLLYQFNKQNKAQSQ